MRRHVLVDNVKSSLDQNRGIVRFTAHEINWEVCRIVGYFFHLTSIVLFAAIFIGVLFYMAEAFRNGTRQRQTLFDRKDIVQTYRLVVASVLMVVGMVLIAVLKWAATLFGHT